MQINSHHHCTIGGNSHEVVFRHKKPINWLTYEERKGANGIECEGGEIINEESLSKELENENDQGVLNNLRGLEILGVRVPLKPTPKGAKEPSSTLQHSNDRPQTLLPALLMSGKATPKAATPEPSLPRAKRLYQDLILSPKRPRNIQDDAPLEGNTSNQEDEPGKVTILAKVASFQPEIFAASRPIAVGELADRGLQFHNMEIPSEHTILIFRGTRAGEMKPIIGGQLDYEDPLEGYINLAQVDVGMLFHWPTSLIQRNGLPVDFDLDLRPPFQESGCEIPGHDAEYKTDLVLKRVRTKTLKARDQMVQQYAKSHEIEVFTIGDVVSLKLPGGSGGVRTATDSRRLFCTVRQVPKAHRYELQTKYGVLDRLVPTRELKKVPRLLADSEEMRTLVNGPLKKVSMRKIGEMASTSDRVLISCRCKAECSSRKCRCFKEGKRCSVHCHASAEHNCGFLATVAARTESAKKRGETTGADTVENCITVDG